MFTLTALVFILTLYMILALVLVVRGGNRAVGHARSRRRGNWFLDPTAA